METFAAVLAVNALACAALGLLVRVAGLAMAAPLLVAFSAYMLHGAGFGGGVVVLGAVLSLIIGQGAFLFASVFALPYAQSKLQARTAK